MGSKDVACQVTLLDGLRAAAPWTTDGIVVVWTSANAVSAQMGRNGGVRSFQKYSAGDL